MPAHVRRRRSRRPRPQMQSGFALLEAGTVRAKNTKNILLKVRGCHQGGCQQERGIKG